MTGSCPFKYCYYRKFDRNIEKDEQIFMGHGE